MAARPVALVLGIAALGAACSANRATGDGGTPDGDLTDAAADAAQALEVEALATALATSLQLGVPAGASPGAASDAASRPVPLLFRPAGCLASTRATDAPNKVAHTLTDCAGPWGLAKVSGTITATYTAAPLDGGGTGLGVEVRGDELTFARGRGSLAGVGVLAAEGAARTLTLSAEARGITRAGKTFARALRATVRWSIGETCVSVDATAQGEIGARPIETTLAGYQRCRGECPEAGGRVTVRLPRAGVSATYVTDGECAIRREL